MTESPVFDFNKLRGRIVEKYGGQGRFAEALGMSEGTLSGKLTGKSYFSANEIYRASELLDVGLEEINQYFFAVRV